VCVNVCFIGLYCAVDVLQVVWFPPKDSNSLTRNNSFLALGDQEHDPGDSTTDVLALAAQNAERNREHSTDETEGELLGQWVNDSGETYTTYLAENAAGNQQGGGQEDLRYVSDEEGDFDYSDDGQEDDTLEGSTVTTSAATSKYEDQHDPSDGCDEAGRVVLSSYVFLSPTWLNKAVKGVMNREAMERIESDR
jgi:hypothetical protein